MSDKIKKPQKKRKPTQTRKWLPGEIFEILSYMRDLHIQDVEPQVRVFLFNFLRQF